MVKRFPFRNEGYRASPPRTKYVLPVFLLQWDSVESCQNSPSQMAQATGRMKKSLVLIPIPSRSMYGIYTYIYSSYFFMVNVGKYTIHGWYGINLAVDALTRNWISVAEFGWNWQNSKDHKLSSFITADQPAPPDVPPQKSKGFVRPELGGWVDVCHEFATQKSPQTIPPTHESRPVNCPNVPCREYLPTFIYHTFMTKSLDHSAIRRARHMATRPPRSILASLHALARPASKETNTSEKKKRTKNAYLLPNPELIIPPPIPPAPLQEIFGHRLWSEHCAELQHSHGNKKKDKKQSHEL